MASPAPHFRHAVHHFRDPEEFGIALSGARLAADFMTPLAMPAYAEQFQAPGWTLDFHVAHVKARVQGALPPGWATIGVMQGVCETAWHGQPATRGALVCIPPGEHIDGRIAPGHVCAVVNVPVALWEKCRALAGISRAAFGSVAPVQMPAPLYARIERQLRATRQLLRSAATPQLASLAAREAAGLATWLATTAWELSSTVAPLRDSPRNRVRLAHRAEAWMRDRLAEPVQVPDMCLALHVSRRELEYAFRAAFDQSPRDFLHALRLNAIHRALLRRDSCESVIHVAFDYGIAHLGRFAAHYRALFGENPSETRRHSVHFT